MATTPDLLGTNPLGAVQWPQGDPSIQKPAVPKPRRDALGFDVAGGLAIPIDLSFPLATASPLSARVYENKIVRCKFIFQGKIESAIEDSAYVQPTADLKINPVKNKGSLELGAKAVLAESVDKKVKLELQASYKLDGDVGEMIDLLGSNPAKFKYALLRNFDAVLGVTFKLNTDFIKTAGVGITFDPDFCFFGIITQVQIPLLIPLGGNAKGTPVRFSGKLIFKFGPSKHIWFRLFKKFGGRQAGRMLIEAMNSITRTLPSEAAGHAAKTAANEAAAWGGEAVAEATIVEAVAAWVGIALVAAAMAVAIEAFMADCIRTVRLSGAAWGDLNMFANTYMRTVYGLDIPFHAATHSQAVKRAAIQRAQAHMEQYGTTSLRRYLEQHFNNSRPAADAHGKVHDSTAVTVMAERYWMELSKLYKK